MLAYKRIYLTLAVLSYFLKLYRNNLDITGLNLDSVFVTRHRKTHVSDTQAFFILP